MTELKRERPVVRDHTRENWRRVGGLAMSVVVVAFGALMIADAIAMYAANITVIFGSTDPMFEFWVGVLFVIIAAFMMRVNESLLALERLR